MKSQGQNDTRPASAEHTSWQAWQKQTNEHSNPKLENPKTPHKHGKIRQMSTVTLNPKPPHKHGKIRQRSTVTGRARAVVPNPSSRFQGLPQRQRVCLPTANRPGADHSSKSSRGRGQGLLCLMPTTPCGPWRVPPPPSACPGRPSDPGCAAAAPGWGSGGGRSPRGPQNTALPQC